MTDQEMLAAYDARLKELFPAPDGNIYKLMPEGIKIGAIRIETNHGSYELKDAVWVPFAPYYSESLRKTYNQDGRQGYIKGMVVRGGETSRLFHATSFTNHAGQEKEFHYCHADRMRLMNCSKDWKAPYSEYQLSISLVTCG